MSKMKNELKNDPLMPIRHSTEHVMQLVIEKVLGAKKVMGPAIDNGFYGDFDGKITEEDLEKIQSEMEKVIKNDLPISMGKISYEDAKETFKNNKFKLEIIEEVKSRGEEIGVCEIGKKGEEYYDIDICGGPHVESTGKINPKAIKLLSIAGAYWKGDSNKEMLTRVYGTVFFTEEELKKHLDSLEDAKRRDHRKLGRELDLFTFSDAVGSGLPLYTPRGAFIRRTITNFVESVQSELEYTQVWTPQIAKAELFKKSGHYDKYKDDMFRVVSNYSDEEFFLKPMNCPQHAEIYASKPRSYRDLPLRLTDFAMLYRDEKPGELNGLARVRSFSQDDCHVYCREDQVDYEIDMMLKMTKQIMETFGFKYRYRMSIRDPQHPEKYLGDPKVWDKLEKWAEDIMERNGIEYFDGPGEAAFYAPKMDLMATDALGREWQLSTVQIDFVQPERFDLTYTNNEGGKSRPVTIHRAIVGSPERLMMILIEHYAGAFPVWLAPTQVSLIPIGEKHVEYAKGIGTKLKELGIRAVLEDKNETMQVKIRNAQGQKIPYMFIIGDREVENNEVSVRLRSGDNKGSLKLDEITSKIKEIELTKGVDLW